MECDTTTLRRALERTADKRGSSRVFTIYPEILAEIRESDTLRAFWKKYQGSFEYAKDISFDAVCNTIQAIMDTIMAQEN